MHSRLGSYDLKCSTQLRIQGLHKAVSPLHVQHLHSPDVACEMSFANEVTYDSLIKSRGENVSRIPICRKRGHQVLRHENRAQPNPRKQYFAECADVNHARVLVQSLKRNDRTAAETILAI